MYAQRLTEQEAERSAVARALLANADLLGRGDTSFNDCESELSVQAAAKHPPFPESGLRSVTGT